MTPHPARESELTEHRELILKASGIQTATCSCLSVSGSDSGGEGRDSGHRRQEQCSGLSEEHSAGGENVREQQATGPGAH